jgi:hypothetical protein
MIDMFLQRLHDGGHVVRMDAIRVKLLLYLLIRLYLLCLRLAVNYLNVLLHRRQRALL